MIRDGRVSPEAGIRLLKTLQITGKADIDAPGPIYCRNVWKRKDADIPPAHGDSSGHGLLFDDTESLFEELTDRYRGPSSGGGRLILVKPGETFKQIDDRTYIIHPDAPDDYRKLLAALKDRDIIVSCILHLWSKAAYTADPTLLTAALEKGFYSLFHLSKSLAATKPKDPIQLVYVYSNPPETCQPQYAALSGFAKTIILETSKLIIKTVGLSDFDQVPDLFDDMVFSQDGIAAEYRGEERWIQQVEEIDPPAEIGPQLPFKEKGVYVLTGGAGGLGMLLAEYLAERVRARLVLVGRSPLDREKTERIDALEAMGSEVLYIRGDVTRREDMEAVIDQTKARFNAVNGIVHAAGLIRDAYFYNKSVKDAGSVLAPKVFGTVYLDEATKTEPIDFFCLFSSITSVFGNAGQSDYAFANGFLDGFAKLREMRRAEKRRFGKTLSINWPLWQSGGMQVDPETKTYLSKSLGMELLDSKTGLDVFSRALNIDSSQVAVVSGDPARLRKTLSIKQTHDQTDDQTYGRVSSELSNTTTDMALVKSLRNDLKVLVSDTIRVDVAEVDSDEEIHALGFDSISLTELANQINDRYRVGITPAIFFEHPTVNRLIDYLRHAYPKEISVYFKIESKPAAESPGKEPIPKRGFHPRIKPRGKAEDGGGARREIFAKNDPVAIIGMAGVMPQSTDLNRFWHHLETGQDLITEVPADRWNWRDWYGDPREAGNQTLSKWGGFMTEVDKFDCLFFGISPKEAELMDPQQRIFLEITWKTIEDAGYKPSDLAGSRTGLFVGVASRDYMDVVREYVTEIEPHAATGMSHSVLANRISYLLDLNGPSEPIDTACSSSLVAIHRAIEAIQSGTCEMAIAGGVNVMLTPTLTIGFDKAGMLSPDGRCKTFDQAANGYVRGEGAGAILLKPLNRAISDEDHIHAVIRSTAENHGGRSASLTAPNPKAQAQLLVDAYEKADIEPDTVGYIETHGTGTHLGDPVEINGLIKAFKELYARSGKDMPKKPNCGLGTVKSNIGHLETAAGIAGVIKTILSLKNRKLPASLHFKTLNPYIQLAGSPFYVVSETKAWEPPTGADGTLLPRRAGVSSFGFGGANAHVVLEEYVDEVRGKRLGVRGGNSELKAQSSKLKVEPQLIVLSAKNEERLRDYAKRMAEFLESAFSFEPSAFNLSDIAYTLQVGREPMEWRLALVSDSIDGISEKLSRYAGEDHGIDDFHVGRAGPKEEAAFDPVQNGKGNGSLVDMAKRWVSGMDVDWETLHFGSNPHRVSLPTYPFERERHWVGDPEIPAPVEPMGEISGPLQEKTENHLKGVLAEILKLATTRIDTHARMEIYGLDSIMINRFNQKMESLLGPLPRTLLFEHQTLRDLATYLVRHHGQELVGFFGLSNTTTRPASMGPGVKPKKWIRPLVKKPQTTDNEGIAIIGVSGRYPLSRSLEEYWENLKSGRDCIREIPKNRWDYQDFYDPDPRMANEGKAYCKWGGFLDDADKFDPLFFNIAPKEAETMDPQERLFLETAWETLEDAGYSISRLNGAGSDVGVFVGVTTNTYLLLNSGTPGRMPKSLPWSIANRVSYTFDFHGPSLPVDTACSASLYAIHLACESISKGECGFALAGGVNLYLHPSKYIQLCQTRMLSPNGRCHSFGAGGDGFVPGEGVGAVLLRPLTEAVENRDRIYAVIKGSAINHGGKTNGYTVPNPNAQAALIETALEKAGTDPRTITYIEAHGTGTALGDPVEIRGLTTAYRNHTTANQYCAIGAVKSNIGHLEAAAGIAGLTKILLQMSHKQLVPSLHADTTNPNIRFKETPFYVQQELGEWQPEKNGPRRAGLSSFGAGGANAHLIVEEYEQNEVRGQGVEAGSESNGGQGEEPQLIVLSAKTEERLKVYTAEMVEFISKSKKRKLRIEDVAYTLQIGRETMDVRLAAVASGLDELKGKLSDFTEGKSDLTDVFYGNKDSHSAAGELLIDGEAGDAFLKVIFDNRDLRKMARLWVSGVKIDWNCLNGQGSSRLLSLPTYPFVKERYWISKPDGQEQRKERSLPPDWLENLFYQPYWMPRPLDSATLSEKPSRDEKKTILIICPADILKMSAALASFHPDDTVMEIRLGKETRRHTERAWEIDTLDPLSLEQSMGEIGRVDHIYFLGGIVVGRSRVEDINALEQNQQYGVLTLFRLIKSMIRSDLDQSEQRLSVITNDVHQVLSEDRIRPFSGSLHGLTKVIAREHKQMTVCCIDISLAGILEPNQNLFRTLLRPVVEEPGGKDRIEEIAIRNGTRYVRVVEPIRLPPVTETPFKEKGVYLILGGSGGIGMQLSRFLAADFKARLILIGRKPMDEQLHTQVDQIEALGGKVLYIPADATDTESMQAAVETGKSSFGTINGVIHSAIVLRDKALFNMDEETFRAALSPKVKGSAVLYSVVKDEPLDFFMFFSSAQSHIVNSGQSNYAAACTFKDAFALYLNQKTSYPVKIINWGYWGSTGVAASEEYNRRLSAFGIGSIEPEEGMEAVRRILVHPVTQVMPFKATDQFLTSVGIHRQVLKGNPEAADDVRGIPIKPESIESIIEKIVAESLRNVLGLSGKPIDKRKQFSEYGVDSVMGIELIDSINEFLKLPLKTTIIFDHVNVADLSQYIYSEYGNQVSAVLSSMENPVFRADQDQSRSQDIQNEPKDEIFHIERRDARTRGRPVVSAERSKNIAKDGTGSGRDIAVVGMSGRFPGAENLDRFWQNLAQGKSGVTEAPKNRWDSALYYDPDPSRTDKTYCKWGGFLSDIDRFDPLFFNMSGKEAEETDPQQRLFLQACWSALEDAGYSSQSMSNSRCGVFAGVAPGDYDAMLETPSLLGNSTSILVSRISYLLNLKGPSVAIDTACSSSLVAVHLGCQSILTGESDMALAGGVFINTTPVFHIVTSNGGMLSPTGKCKTFDDTADGFVPGEGVGVVVLKPLNRAVADKDYIYGVIQGSGINQDGKTNGITAPSARSQTELELSVYRRSGINPESISYVEAHGTGTKLGDPVEIEALTHAFSQYTDRREFCGIGSVKTNMGHASYASGVAGLIKVLLAIRHRQLPPSLNFHTPNRHIDFKDSPFYVNTRLRNWETEADWPRRAAVSSFGYSGTNAHLVVEEYKGSGFRVQGSGFSAEPQLIVLSARNEDRLKAYVEILEEFLTSTLNSERLTLNLSDVTYTLQVGRDEMEYRLALVVSSLEELKGRLGRFAGGQTDIPDLFSGNIETGTETGWGSPDEADGKEKAEKLLLERDLRKIAESWVAGGVFDWNCLYPNHTPRRIPLPTYPFARERYWVPSKEERKPLSVERPDRLPALHPLIDSNESTLAEQCFKKTLSGDAFYLKDHVVGGASVLPGVIYLEMARAAGALSMENSSVKRLRNIVWATPIRVDVSSKETYIRLWPGEKGVEYEISTDNQTQNRTEDRIIHSRGNLDFGDPDPEPDHPEAVDAIRNRLAGHQTRKDFYRRFESYGFNYGPSFRIVEEIHHNDAEALSVLVLPESLRSAAGAFMLHPSLMDGALQTVAGLMGDRGEERVYLPYAMRELALIRPLTDRCCAHVLLKESFGDSAISKFDIDILNESGESLIRIKDFSIRGVEMKHQNTDTDTGIGYFRLDWKSSPQADAAYASDRGPVLLFDMDASRSGAVAKRLGAETILVLPGTKFEIKNRNTLVINPGDPDQYRQLMSRLTEEGRVPNRFIHLWSQGSFDADKNRLSTQIDMGLNSIFHLTQTLMERKPTTARHLLYIYHEPEQAIQPQYAAVSGFVKTVRLENPNLIFKTIGISDLAAVPDIVQTEFHSTDGTEIRYENRRRYVRDFSSHEAESVTESLNYLKEQGVYIITGGAGGIGLTLSDYLCGKGNIHLFLSGRSPLNQKVSEKIETLKKSGSRVEYIRADVSNPADTGRLVSRIVSEHGRIDGIFHAAGILRDGLIFGTKGEDLASVLAPKVWGTLHLDNATKTEPLDFFVMFSSATAVMGNIGQSGYAFANGFMDHFAKWRETMRRMSRRSGRTLSVNWPLWEDGGMGMDESSRKWMIDKTGMVPLSAEKGLRALDHALQTDLEQLMVFNGDNEKIRQVWTYSNQIRSERHASETPTIGPMGAPLQNNAEAYLKEFLAEEIRLPVSKIRTTDPFEKYGIDSVMVMNLTRKLETGFGELSKTLFFEYRNISELAAYFINRHRAKLIEHLKESRSAPIEINDGVQSASKDIMAPKRDRFVRATDRYSSPPSPTEKNDIAIVGLSGRYPMAGNLNEFWENLKTGKDCISEIPRSRWDYHPLFDPDRNKTKEGKIYTKWGGFMDDVDKFDTLFFHISPKEAKLIDPQERLFLETVWHTLEDAGYTRKGVDDRSVGVFVGVMWGEYQLFGAEEALKGNMIAPRSSYASISNRVSYVFNFTGPSITLDTMCSSSLTAIHLACESIRKGESGLAVAGGVNVSIHMQKYLHLSQGVFASSDGRCRSFGEGGDGYVPGEGVGAVLLKPLKDAVRDGDHIYGVIRGTAINHGGKTNGYTVPNPNAQAGLIAEAIRSADIDPRSISYLEAHGTGTALGDPIEITGLMKAFGDDLKEKQFCAIGSVKSNIGHLESAAGIAGLTKVLLQMKHRQLVPSLHSKQLNPNIKFENSPFYVQRELGEWKQPVLDQGGVERPVPRRAGISSFGAGGANAHLVLEEFQEPEPKAQSSKLKVEPQLIVLSAKNEDRLRECAKRLAEFVESAFSIEPSAFSLTDIAYTLQVGREAMDYRLAIPVHGMEDMKEKLEQYLNGADKTGCVYQGHTGPDQIGLDGMMEGEEGKQFIDSLMNNRKLDRLAQLWGSGANVDWRRLHAGRTPKRLPLPTYPFAKERYWVSTVPLPFFQKAGRLHPFIDSIDMKQSVRQGMTFQKRFANSDRILTDHCVNGTSILPGVGIAEMIHAAGSMIGDTGTGRLSRLIWQRPVTVDQDPIDVTVVVTEKDDHYACLVRSRQGFESITHATAAFHPEPAAPEPSAGPISLTDIKGRCFQEMDAEAFYRRYDEYGIGYGDYLRGVRHIWGNDEESLARIQLPEQFQSEFEDYTLHPGLADAGLQAIAGITSVSDTWDRSMMVPYAVEEIEIIQPLKSSGYAYVKRSGKRQFDVCLTDENGNICVAFKDLAVKALPDPYADFFYVPRWQYAPLETGVHTRPLSPGKRKVLIIHPTACFGLEMALAELHALDEVYAVRLGRETRQISEKQWEAGIDDPYALGRTVEAVGSVHQIYFLGGIQPLSIDCDDPKMLAQSQDSGLRSLFRFIKAMTKQDRVQIKPKLTIVTNDVYRIGLEDVALPLSGGLGGLAKVIDIEYRELGVDCIDISLAGLPENPEPETLASLIMPVFREAEQKKPAMDVAVRDGRRYVRVLEPIRLPAYQSTPFRNKGVYFIVGGAGGIGFELSLHLARTVKARLIWIGRRAIDEQIEAKIEKVDTLGGSVRYISADAANLESMKEALESAKSCFGAINGVIHSAIVLKDKALFNMEEDALNAVLAPKVAGSLVLHNLFRKEPLDFMMFFSSAQTFFASAGQGNYAAASTFEDAYADYIRTQVDYPVKVINWGYWGSIGIVSDERYLKRLSAQGIGSIEPKEGMEAIARILTHRVSPVIPFKASKDLLKKMGLNREAPLEVFPVTLPSGLQNRLPDIQIPPIDSRSMERFGQGFARVNRFSRYLLMDAFNRMHLFQKSGEAYDREGLKRDLNILPGYHRLYDVLVYLLSDAGWIREDHGRLITTEAVDENDFKKEIGSLEDQKDDLMRTYPELGPYTHLLWVCLKAYPDILRGERSATDVLFPDSSMALVEEIYKGNANADYFNHIVVQFVRWYVEDRLPKLSPTDKINMIEVGAGTGGTSALILDAIHAYGDRVHYAYTDVSQSFINHGKSVSVPGIHLWILKSWMWKPMSPPRGLRPAVST